MFWDNIAGLYDLFENIYNRKVYNGTGVKVAEQIDREDIVLECACGTGAISKYIALSCKELFATDFSLKMLRKAERKLSKADNVKFSYADISKLEFHDNSFDKVVAGNVIHLLPEPKKAIDELIRVCKNNGYLIIPTYINKSKSTNKAAVRFLEKLGADFKRQFDSESYENFFTELGFKDVKYVMVEGRMACDIAIIKIRK